MRLGPAVLIGVPERMSMLDGRRPRLRLFGSGRHCCHWFWSGTPVRQPIHAG